MESNKKMQELNMEQLEQVTGGLVMQDSDENKFWIVRQDGTIIAPAPSADDAVSFAKAFSTSPTMITKEDYRRMFGRDPVW